jgi:CheY-like chemotaxis protein
MADDDISDRYLFKDAIGQINKNISLKLIDGGNELMNYLLNQRNRLPDLLFLDLNMPHKNGLMCLEEIRSHDRLKKMNIVIYSASSKLENIEMSLNKGANLYFAKSSTFQDLINRLNRILKMNWDEFNADSMEKFVLSDEVGL